MAIKQLGLCHPSSKWCPEPHLARVEALLPAHAQTGPGFVPSRPVGELTVAQEIPTVSCGETTGKRGYRYQKNKHLLNKEPSFSHWQFFRWLPWRVFKWTNKHQDISVIQQKMGIRPFRSERTDNHVKRVSCRDTSSTMVTSLGLSLSVIMLTLGPCHAAAGDISCQGIRYTYFEKGLDTSDIPAAPQQGERNIILPTVIRVSHDLLLPALRLRHFVIVTLIILKDVFLGKDICCAAHCSKKQLLEARSGCCFCVHYWQWFINGRVFVIIEFPRV